MKIKINMHDNAAGYSLPKGSYDKLHKIANEELKQYNLGEDVYDVNFIRSEFDNDIVDIINDINKYKNIWSTGNPEPLINVTNMTIKASEVTVMGKDGSTCKFTKNGVTYIKFFAKDFIEEIKKNKTSTLNLVGKMTVNVWKDLRTPQIIIDNYEIKEDLLMGF